MIYDFNRDGRVDLIDVGLARINQSGFTPLQLITAPDGSDGDNGFRLTTNSGQTSKSKNSPSEDNPNPENDAPIFVSSDSGIVPEIGEVMEGWLIPEQSSDQALFEFESPSNNHRLNSRLPSAHQPSAYDFVRTNESDVTANPPRTFQRTPLALAGMLDVNDRAFESFDLKIAVTEEVETQQTSGFESNFSRFNGEF